MPTSGSADFNATQFDICTKALRRLGVVAAGETATAEDMASAVESLNLMVKGWETEGIYLWSNTEDTFNTVAGTASYLFGAAGTKTYKPLRITSVRVATSATTDLPLIPIGRQEYFDLPNKTSQGVPTMFFYDPQRSSGTLYLWPIPAAVAALKYTYVRSLEDFDNNADLPDVPQEWLNALVWNLAVEMAPEFGVSGSALTTVAAFAEKHKSSAMNWDQDMGDITIQPDPNWMGF